MSDLTKLTNDELLQNVDYYIACEIMRRLEWDSLPYHREDGERIYPTQKELNELAIQSYTREKEHIRNHPEIFGDY